MAKLEKVIKGLENCGDLMFCEKCPYNDKPVGCFERMKDDALELLKERQWVSTEESLPSPGKDVLTLDNEGNYYVDHVLRDGRWQETESEWNPVKWWTPLPEPPKEGDKE